MRELRVLIFSAAFGAGHLRSAQAVIEAIRINESSAQIIHADCGECLGKTVNTLLRNSYISMIKHSPGLWGGIWEGMAKIEPDSLIQRFLNKLGRTEYKKIIESCRPHLIVCTYPTVAGVLSEMRLSHQLHVPLVTVVTDYVVHNQWIHRGVDLYIVGSRHVSEGFAAKGIRPERIRVTGIPVAPVFEQQIDLTRVQARLGLSPELPTLLIMGGALGVLDSMKEHCQIFANADYPLQSIVVCGSDEKLYRSLDEIVVNARNPVVRFGFVNNVEELMTAADLMITKAGGLTVSEALTKRLPMVIFRPIPGQEKANADFLSEIGAGRFAHTQDELAGIVQFLFAHPEELAHMREAAAHAVPGHSAERAVESMLNLLNENHDAEINNAQAEKIG